MRNEVPGSTLEYYVPGSTQDISLLLLLLLSLSLSLLLLLLLTLLK